MKRSFFTCLIAAVLLALIPMSALAAYSAAEVRASMFALQDEYYEGRPWSNEQSYAWKGDNSVGYGCAAFAFRLSDAAFGSLPARKYTTVNYSALRVGDILRLNNDTHTAVILYKYDDHLLLVEGNVNGAIRWGRRIEKDEAEHANYYLTRYPEGSSTSQKETAPNITVQPVSKKVPENYQVVFSLTAQNATSYQWYSRPSSTGTWTAVRENGTSASYSFTAKLSHDGSQYRCLVRNDQDSVFSNTATLLVVPVPVITKHPESVTVKPGATATFSVTATGENLQYQWYYVKPGDNELVAITENGTKPTYSLVAQEQYNGYVFRCKVYNENAGTYSRYATLTVDNGSQPAQEYKDVIVNEGDSVSFGLQQNDQYTYQWYYLEPGKTDWTLLTQGGTSPTITIEKISVQYNGYQYRCRISNAAGASVYSFVFRLTVVGASKPAITTQPASKTVSAGAKVEFKVEATNANSYQWYYRKPNATSWTATTKTSAAYSLTAKETLNGFQYKCKVSNDAGFVWSEAATLTVKALPVITTQPASKTVNAGEKAAFKVVASNATSYQWYYRKTNTASWTATTKTTATYSLTAGAVHNGFQYKCKVSNDAGFVWSEVATLTVKVLPVITIQPASKTAAVGAKVEFKVAASNATSYQWYYKKLTADSWTATTKTTATYSLTAKEMLNGFQYKCKVSNDEGFVWSDIAVLTVN